MVNGRTTRLGTLDDIDEASGLWERAHQALLGRVPEIARKEFARKQLQARLQDESARLFVAEIDDRIVGTAMAIQALANDGLGPPVAGLMHVAFVAVDPANWGAGIATGLLADLTADAVSRRYQRLQLWALHENVRARRLYEHIGFQPTGRSKESDFGDLIVHYEKRIAPAILGKIEKRPISIVEYDPTWVDSYQQHAAKIRGALGASVVRIEHIGSTSVPGLAAKPIVDILLVLRDPADEAGYVPAMEAAGYELRVREPEVEEHRMFRTAARDVHIHVYPPGAEAIERYFLFRDRLRTNTSERDLYVATKRELASRDWDSMNDYATAKTGVIESILSRARQSEI